MRLTVETDKKHLKNAVLFLPSAHGPSLYILLNESWPLDTWHKHQASYGISCLKVKRFEVTVQCIRVYPSSVAQ